MERSNVSESSSEEDQRVDMENTEHQTSEMEVSETVVTENQEESDDIIPPTQFDAAVKTSKLRLKNGKTVSTLVFKTTHLLAGPNKQLRISCPENYAKIIKKPIDVSKIKVPSTSDDVSTSKVRKTGGICYFICLQDDQRCQFAYFSGYNSSIQLTSIHGICLTFNCSKFLFRFRFHSFIAEW